MDLCPFIMTLFSSCLYSLSTYDFRGLLRQKLKHVTTKIASFQKTVKFKIAGRSLQTDLNHKNSNSSLEVEY